MERSRAMSFDESEAVKAQQKLNDINSLLQKFQNFEDILENAALTAAFLNYLYYNQEYYSLLYYFAVQKYQRINETKNSMRNYNHINMEIYTVFIHDKSILSIPFHHSELIEKIGGNLDSEECMIYFQQLSEIIAAEVLSKYVEQFRHSIRMGSESYCYEYKIHEEIDRAKELKILETLNSAIVQQLIRSQKIRCLPSQIQDIKCLQILKDFEIRSINIGLNTAYEYFISSKRYSYIMKHPENSFSFKTFLSAQKAKSLSKLKIKCHCFEEHTLPKASFCLVCNLILWGSDPQCLYCRNCKNAIHRECKDSVRNCQLETKAKTDDTELRSDNGVNGEDPITDGEVFSPINTQAEATCNLENDEYLIFKSLEKIKVPRKFSISKLQEFKEHCSSTFTSDKPWKKSIKSTKSMNSKNDGKKGDEVKILRSESVRTSSPEGVCPQDITKLNMRSTSEDSGLASLVESSVTLQFDGDAEMNVLETFEPEIESKVFSKILSKTSHHEKGEYNRRLVLMEFHHKSKFVRMTLKRFKYLLVDPWRKIGEHLDLFDSLSLSSIEKLYILIGSLVDVIDSCKGEDSYDSSIGTKILAWISDNDGNNQHCWFQLSADLCCTNILQSIKSSWMEVKLISPKLNDLFSVEINRLLIMEQLSNMRSLLFNLPMIVTKIIKDLNKFTQFKDEAKIWEQVGQKLNLIPHMIDERCMPLVDLINNGTIQSSALKYKQNKIREEYSDQMKAYINNFPKAVFKNNFVDFKFVKISNIRESYVKQSSDYVKEETDAAVICYENEMIILQKDNDKYLLKLFKSSDGNRLFPMIPFNHVHVIKHTIKENKYFEHELTVILINKAILIQILFRDEKARDMWFDHITKISTKLQKEGTLMNQAPIKYTEFSEEKINSICTSDTSGISRIRMRYIDCANHFINSFNDISKELSEHEVHNQTIEKIEEHDFMHTYMDILKQYAIVGTQMIDQSKSDLEKHSIQDNLSKIKDITNEMLFLIRSQEQVTNTETVVESSDTPTIDNEEADDNLLNVAAFVDALIERVSIEHQKISKTEEFEH